MKKIFIVLLLVLFAGIAYSQVAGIPSFPPNFSYSLPSLPLPQNNTQLFLANCPYAFPIELKDVQIYSVGGSALAPEIEAQIRVYTNNKKSVCSYKKTYTISPAINSNALVGNFANALNNELLSSANANTQPVNPNGNPISSST